MGVWDTIRCALELEKHDELVRIDWNPILDTANHQDDPSILNQVPLSCGVADGEIYCHGTDPKSIVSISLFGLHPSDEGVGSGYPVLYTCKNRQTPASITAKLAGSPWM